MPSLFNLLSIAPLIVSMIGAEPVCQGLDGDEKCDSTTGQNVYLLQTAVEMNISKHQPESGQVIVKKCEDHLKECQLASAGTTMTIRCPAGCFHTAGGMVFGTNDYAWYSRVCLSAIHAGVITDSGGTIGAKCRGSQTLTGSARNEQSTPSKGVVTSSGGVAAAFSVTACSDVSPPSNWNKPTCKHHVDAGNCQTPWFLKKNLCKASCGNCN